MLISSVSMTEEIGWYEKDKIQTEPRCCDFINDLSGDWISTSMVVGSSSSGCTGVGFHDAFVVDL